MHKVALLGLASAAMLAMPAVAVAQTPPEPLVVQVEGNVTPTEGGSKKKPKNGKIRLAFTANQESRKTVEDIIFYTPSNLKLSGKGFKFCSAGKINSQGADDCPKKSKVGVGSATAVLGPNQDPVSFDVDVYLGSPNELALYLQGRELQDVNVAFVAPITAAGKPFGQKIAVRVPEAVQQPAPGLYSYITGVDTTIGGVKSKRTIKKKGKKRKKTVYFASLTGCPNTGVHDLGVQLKWVTNDAGDAGVSEIFRNSSTCKRK